LEVSDVESTQWLNLTNCGVVRVKAGEISLAELELELSEIYCKEWPWQIRELEKGNFLVRFPTHKKVADIKKLSIIQPQEKWCPSRGIRMAW
jgi:hypothetical protein